MARCRRTHHLPFVPYNLGDTARLGLPKPTSPAMANAAVEFSRCRINHDNRLALFYRRNLRSNPCRGSNCLRFTDGSLALFTGRITTPSAFYQRCSRNVNTYSTPFRGGGCANLIQLVLLRHPEQLTPPMWTIPLRKALYRIPPLLNRWNCCRHCRFPLTVVQPNGFHCIPPSKKSRLQ